MKRIFSIGIVFLFISLNALSKDQNASKASVNATKKIKKVEKVDDKKDLKPKEDCHKKAEKVIKIEPESISLGSGSTGCSLEGI